MVRRALFVSGALVVGAVVVCAAAAAAILATAPGHAVARRLLVGALTRAVDGRVEIGSLSGPLWRRVILENVELATPDGRPVIRVARVAASYSLADLVRGRFVGWRVDVNGPAVTLEEGTDGHLNVEHLFRLLGPHNGPPGRRPLVELRDVRLVHGTFVLRERNADGSLHERRFAGVGLDLPELRVSDPDSSGVAAEVRHLAVSVSDPAARVADASGRVVIEGDSVTFDLPRLALGGTAGAARGVVRWGAGASHGRAKLDLAANLQRASFADFRWAAPGLPAAGGGRVAVRARLLPAGEGSAWSFRNADLRSGRSRVRGTTELAVGPNGVVTIRTLDVETAPLDLVLLQPFLGKLPVTGTVSGHVRASGRLDALTVGEGLVFTDERAAGRPANVVVGSGVLALGGPSQVAFHSFQLTESDIALATIEDFAPSIKTRGRLSLVGELEGPWRDATFRGTLVHSDGTGAGSTLRGSLQLTLADTLHVEADLTADSLSLDDVARSYPSLAFTGPVAGSVRLSGPMTALTVRAALAGAGGGVTMDGTVAAGDSAVRISGGGRLDGLDLARYVPGAPPTALHGDWRVNVAIPTADTTAGTTGTLAVDVDSGVVAGGAVGRADAQVTLSADAVAIDTLSAQASGTSLAASGALGRAGRAPGVLRLALRADTLADLLPWVTWLRREAGDSASVELGGAGRISGRLEGTTTAWVARGELTLDSVGYGPVAAVALRVEGSLERADRGLTFGLRAHADSLAVAGMRYGAVGIAATGPLDSLRLSVGAGFGASSSVQSDLTVGVDSAGWRVRIASGRLTLPGRVWTLRHPAGVAATAGSIAVDSLELRAQGGASVQVAGRLPQQASGDLTLEADSVPLSDVYALAELDTTGIGGLVSARVRMTGSAAAPFMEATASLVGGRFGDFGAPLVDGSARYGAGRLSFRAGLESGGAPVVTASGSLPLDLSLRAVAKRELPDSLRIRVAADSADLAILDALTPLVRGVGGRLQADVTVGGTWDHPELTGDARITDGAVGIPALGARYSGIEARLSLAGDRLRVDEARLKGGSGTLEITGDVRFAALTHPVLDLTLRSRGFAAFSLRDFAGLTATGDLRLTGPAVGATLTGGLVVDAGFLAFADLVEKRIVNLDDPEFRAIVDSNLAQATGLGPSVQNVFLDSLRIRNLTVAMGPDVWLRSHEANIQLAGNFTVAKDVESGVSRYRLDGTLRAVRGTYRLVVGPTAKEFRVTRGTVRFFGTPDLNPVLDIAAEHTVRSVNGGDLVVRAVIGGTLLVPKLSLESDERPPLSETEIVSYLLFGRPSFDLSSGNGTAAPTSEQAIFQGAMVGLAGALSGEIEQTLVTNLGIPVDYLAIRPGGGTVGDIFSSTRVEAGTQLGERTFLTLNAGICQVARGLSSQAIGASVEHRVGGGFTVEASMEPTTEECRPVGFQIRPPTPYQVGLDLFWQWGTP